MQVSLWSHPVGYSIAPLEIHAGVERLSATVLRFRYLMRGHIDGLVIPPVSAPLRSNNLWRTTCFEAFLFRPDGPAYVELNFSPSTQWAAYDFAAYRDGMVHASLPAPPDLEVRRQAGSLELTATISLDAASEAGRLSLCAVVESPGGSLSYWAQSHAGDKPDFHRQDCFTLELPAAGLA